MATAEPPPLPSSPPPDDQRKNGRRASSEKFRAMQKMFESRGTMYSSPPLDPAASASGAPPPKRREVEIDEEPEVGDSPKLTHHTRDRPRRKTRIPSRGLLRGQVSKSQGVGSDVELEAPADVPPPPPPNTAPPEVPSGPPPSLEDVVLTSGGIGIPAAAATVHSELIDSTELPPTTPPTATANAVESQFGSKDETDTHERERSQTSQFLHTEPSSTTASRLSFAAKYTPQKNAGAAPPMHVQSRPQSIAHHGSTTPITGETKTIAIGSFSRRLKDIRQNRAARGLGKTSPLSTAVSPTPRSPTDTITSPTSDQESPLTSQLTQHTSPSTLTSPLTGRISQLSPNTAAFKEPPTPSLLPSTHATADVKPKSATVAPKEPLKGNEEKPNISTSLHEESDSAAEPEIEVPPPPLPSCPPPSIPDFDAPLPKPEAPETAAKALSKRKVDEWKKRSKNLDSLESKPLPLLISSKVPVDRDQSKVAEIVVNKAQFSETPTKLEPAYSTSSESLPSLPDSPPPELPASPPPSDLPELTESMDFLTEDIPTLEHSPVEVGLRGSSRSENLGLEYSALSVTPEEETFPVGTVKHQHPRPERLHSPWSEKRRSAFDSLVATEPNEEEKREPRLSVAEGRSLVMQVSRRPDADAKSVLMRWSAHVTDEQAATPSATDTGSEGSASSSCTKLQALSPASSLRLQEEQGFSSQQRADQSPVDLRISPRSELESSLGDLGMSSKRTRSSSEASALKGSRKRRLRLQQSLPSGPGVYPKVTVIAEGGTMHSPDIKITRVARKRWRKSQPAFDDLASSASTGDIISHPSPLPDRETSSLRSFDSSSESVTFNEPHKLPLRSPLLVSQMKETTTDELVSRASEQTDRITAAEQSPHQAKEDEEDYRSSFVESILSSLPSLKESDTQSCEDILTGRTGVPQTSKENIPGKDSVDETVVMEMRDVLEGIPPTSGTEVEMRTDAVGVKRRRKMRSVNSMITEASIHRKALEEMQGTVTTELASLERMQQAQDQLLEEQLAEIREQQRMAQDLLQGDVSLDSPRDSPRPLRPPTFYLDRDIFEIPPERWSVGEVCQWLELVGLGTFKEAFREKQINGETLLQMDVELFSDLGIDSPEMREIFLAKIYELGNPSASGAEDDFMLSVESYTSEDWNKLQAAVNALKSPILDDTVELEPSAIGQFIHSDYIRSHSTPNIAKLELNEEYGGLYPATQATLSPIHLSPPPTGLVPSTTVHSFPNYALMGATSADDYSLRNTSRSSTGMLQYPGGRARSLTDPTITSTKKSPSKKEQKAKEEREKPPKGKEKEKAGKASATKAEKEKTTDLGEQHISQSEVKVLQLMKEGSITYEDGRFKNRRKHEPRKQSTLKALRPNFWGRRSTSEEAGLIRLYMDTIQEGSLYKAFLATSSTTAEELIKQALQKASILDDPKHYCMWEAAAVPSLTSRAIHPSENPLRLQTHWPQFNSHRFELRVKQGIHLIKFTIELPGHPQRELSVAMATTTMCPEAIHQLLSQLQFLGQSGGRGWTLVEVDRRTGAERVLGEGECPVGVAMSWGDPHNHELILVPSDPHLKRLSIEADGRRQNEPDPHTLLAQIKALEQEKTLLSRQLDSAHLQLQKHQDLEQKVASLREAHTSLTSELANQEQSYRTRIQELQQTVDEFGLRNQKLEDQLLVSSKTSRGSQSNLLDEIQSRYGQEVSDLTDRLRERERSLQEVRAKGTTMEEELGGLRARSKELEQLQKRMAERNQQIKALERDLALKEDTIHRLRAELEDAQLAGDQVVALQKTLQAVEITSKQQQDFTGRTLHELQQELTQMSREEAHREQLMASLTSKRDRLTREHETKDALIASLESDLEWYKTRQSPSAAEGSKVAALERSLTAHERALESLRTEHLQQKAELRAAEEEVGKAREHLSLKEEELSELSTSRSLTERPPLHSLLAYQPPQCIITAEVVPTEQGLGILVTNGPLELGGCVVKEIADFCSTTKLRRGDRLLEINGKDVSSITHREAGEVLQSLGSHSTVQIVVSRPISAEVLDSTDFSGLYGVGSPSGMVIERFKKLNASLNSQLDSQSAEAEHWRQEYERVKAEILKYSTSKKDKESELKLLQSTVQDLQQQLEESEQSRTQMRRTLEEVESSRQQQHQVEALEASLVEREGELKRLRAAEEERLNQLQVAMRQREAAVRTLRQHAVATETLDVPLTEPPSKAEALAQASRSEILASLATTEEDFLRHKAYLDQLLTIIINHSPELLSTMGEAQRMRDQMDSENESWC